MKLKLLITNLLIILLSISSNAFSQDIIILKNGDEIKATVSEIDIDVIKYKKFDNPEGPAYSIKKAEVFMIKYANGTKDVFNTPTETPVALSGTEAQTFTDGRDGKIYKTVMLGTQTWMAENLAYKADYGCWAYDNDETKVKTYGYLYNWETSKNICPAGWHLPSDKEWQTLVNYFGGEKVAGEKFINNGFSVLPGGFRNGFGIYSGISTHGMWWSSSWLTPTNLNAWYQLLTFENNKIEHRTLGKISGFSVRCVKD